MPEPKSGRGYPDTYIAEIKQVLSAPPVQDKRKHMYKENVTELNEKRSKLSSEAVGIRDTLDNRRPVPLEKLVDGMIELVGNLDFTDKKAVIRKLVTKIVATKKEINIWGQIPIPATGQVGYESIYRHCRPS